MIKFRDNIFISNYQDALDGEKLKAEDITAVVNVAFEIPDPTYDPLMFKYAKVGLMDNNQNTPFMKHLAINIVGLLLSNGEKVLVHCSAGQSRSVYVAVMVVSLLEGKDWLDVLAELQQIYPEAMKGPLFETEKTKLSEYLAELEQENRI